MVLPGVGYWDRKEGTRKAETAGGVNSAGEWMASWLPLVSFWGPSTCTSHLSGTQERGYLSQEQGWTGGHPESSEHSSPASVHITALAQGLVASPAFPKGFRRVFKHLKAGKKWPTPQSTNMTTARVTPRKQLLLYAVLYPGPSQEVRLLPICAASAKPPFKPQLSHLLTEPNSLTPVSLSFLTCAMGMTVPFAQTCGENAIG